MLKVISALAGACLLIACVSTHASPPEGQARNLITRGRQIAVANCAACHAIGQSGESPAPEAPTFRTLSRNYRVDTLEEALAEGISVGHPAMPQFQFPPDDVHALVAYLQSVQDNQEKAIAPASATQH